jgi:hypothetical protein
LLHRDKPTYTHSLSFSLSLSLSLSLSDWSQVCRLFVLPLDESIVDEVCRICTVDGNVRSLTAVTERARVYVHPSSLV